MKATIREVLWKRFLHQRPEIRECKPGSSCWCGMFWAGGIADVLGLGRHQSEGWKTSGQSAGGLQGAESPQQGMREKNGRGLRSGRLSLIK